jgi:hypothetical protein
MFFGAFCSVRRPAMPVTFISRTTPKSSEVTIRIRQDAGDVLGEVSAPGGLAGSGTAAEADNDDALGVHQALASAIELAADHGDTVGVIDEEGLWREEWGDLLGEEAI